MEYTTFLWIILGYIIGVCEAFFKRRKKNGGKEMEPDADTKFSGHPAGQEAIFSGSSPKRKIQK